MKHIFIHGIGQTSQSWAHTIEYLGLDQEALCPQLFSSLPDSKKDYRAIYGAFSRYCDHQDGPLALYGIALGGTLAINYTIDQPDKVKSLVVIGSQFKMPKTAMTVQTLVYRALPEEVFLKIGLPRQEAIELMKSMKGLDFTSRLAEIECPTLAVCGQKDTANLGAAEKISKRVANGKLVVIDDSRHDVHMEAPQELAQAIRAHLAEIDRQKGEL